MEPSNLSVYKYTAIIIEPRKHIALPFVLKNFATNLSEEWGFIIFHGINNQEYIENIIKNDLEEPKSRFKLINLNIDNLTTHEYSNILKNKNLYQDITTETFLIFQVDTLIITENKHLINDYLEYDYVGAPWQDETIGNGGLSLRKKSKMLEIIDSIDSNESSYKNEDEYFCRQTNISLFTPSFDKAKQFSVETVFYESPFGVHNFYNHLSKEEIKYLTNKYDELRILLSLNRIEKSIDACFTIVYKTYKNDLKWLEYSLLSLKQFLVPDSIFELIIYVHDVVFLELHTLLDTLQMKYFINFRIIPVHYNYHGYIKQQEVKANCYKDVQTKYVILLDSDLILKKSLNLNSLLRPNGKIEWFYLKKEDNPSHEVFTVWKKACEDSTRTPKTVHYMSNGFPFIFTKQSLEDASNKFKELHNCDYDAYCHNRCGHEGIRVEDSTTANFAKLSRVFTEFEYLGWYCHHFSNDYIFTPTKICRMDAQFQKENPESYFVQNWSHGGLDKEITKNINKIIQNKQTIILVWTQQVNNLVTDDTNNFFGLGDILRGTMAMFQLSKKYDFNLIVDIQLHPVSKYLQIKGHEYNNYVLQNANNIPFIYPENIEQFIQNNNENVCCLLTNSHLIGEVTQECKDFIKNILVPNDEFAKYINDLKIAKNTPANYNILHFRLGDTLLVRNAGNVDFQNYINIMNQHKEPNDILMSDSARFKEQVMTGNYGIFLFHIHVAHLGYANHTSDIKDTLFEFFIITQASKIKTFSNYSHISGFVNLAYLVYDIPLHRIQ